MPIRASPIVLAMTLIAAAAQNSADSAPTTNSIPWSQIGAKAGAGYQGDGLAVSPTPEGARLRCVFQRLEGEATPEGLWLTSTATNGLNDRFRLVATAVGRQSSKSGVRPASGAATSARIPAPSSSNQPSLPTLAAPENGRTPPDGCALAKTGKVTIDGSIVRFTRPGLVEEYGVSMDGVRQDFVVVERPGGTGELAVQLAVSGARVEPAAGGAQLVLENSGRKIAYSRLRATDARGKELTARIEVPSRGDEQRQMVLSLPEGEGRREEEERARRPAGHAPALLVLVNDADAVYPVRIDPTFSDANWVTKGP